MGARDGRQDSADAGGCVGPPPETLLRMALQARTQALLECFRLRPRRSLSQNFLISDGVASALAHTVTDGAGAEAVLVEIGAGLGALTVPLAQSGRELVAIETDPYLIPALHLLLGPFRNVRIEHADVTQVDWAGMAPGRRLAIAGNLPYHLTGLLLRTIMEVGRRCDVAMVTVQAEVAGRVTAQPGGEDYGILSVLAAYYLERVQTVRRLPPGVFMPRPDIDSAALALHPRSDPAMAAGGLTADQERRLLDVVRAAFGHRRKTLRNSLATSPLLAADKGTVNQALLRAGVDGARRAEELPLEAFIPIAIELGDDRGMGS